MNKLKILMFFKGNRKLLANNISRGEINESSWKNKNRKFNLWN